MQKSKFFAVLFSFIGLLTFSAIPLVSPNDVVDIENISSDYLAVLIILEVHKVDFTSYKSIASDVKLSLEEFNVIAFLSSKTGVDMGKIWKWRTLKLSWSNILSKLNLDLDDVIPKAEKPCNEPYKLCYTYWREKGNPKKVFILGDYDFEKICEVITISKYSLKSVDEIIEEIGKGSFRSLSLKYYKEKNKLKKGAKK